MDRHQQLGRRQGKGVGFEIKSLGIDKVPEFGIKKVVN
jgi:hypothetical protein